MKTSHCFHCREPLAGSKLLARIGERSEPVCCSGCQAVAEMIDGSGLSDFYERRTLASVRPDEKLLARDAWLAYVQPDVAASFVRRSGNVHSVDLLIENLRCSACGWLIERSLLALDGVTVAQVNPVVGRAHIEWRADALQLESVMRAIAQLGYVPHPVTDQTTALVYRTTRNAMLKRFVVASFGMMQVMMFAVAGYSAELNSETIDPQLNSYFRLISLLVSIPVLFYAARPFLMNAWNNLRTRTIGMDLPVSAALVLAFGASAFNTLTHNGEVYFDSITMFVFFLTLTRLIEHTVRHRTNSVADALARHLPATAQRIVGDRVESVAAASLRAGDLIVVPSGATVPVDGKVIDGTTTLDESLLTGESLPAMRGAGDAVVSGSINTGAPIRVEVTATGSGTVLSTIAALVRRAQTQRPASIQAADRAASLFLRVVLCASLLVCLGWMIVDPARAFSATLAVLVVACPCAFSIAAPAALAASTAKLAREGVLVANPDAIEVLARLDHVIFDKTGTLTRGQIRLDSYASTGHVGHKDCLALAAALERASEHPIGAAFRDVEAQGYMARDVKIVPGFGVEGIVRGKRYRIGLTGFVAELRGEQRPRTRDALAGSIIVLGDESEELAIFELSDELREDSGETIHLLKTLGVSSEILSGDAHQSVAAIARRCGVTVFSARRSPTQKLARMKQLHAAGACVAMVGDGINDAPVLGAADVSIAMGRGAALAHAAADFIFVSERLASLPELVTTARRTRHIARQNLIWSATYNFCALPLAAFGLISPWIAALGMSASSLFVLINALRLLPKTPRSAMTVSPPDRALNAAAAGAA